MKIMRIIHDDENKQTLFALIGEFCASAKVRQELGGPISSEPGRIWFVALNGDHVAGFASVVPKKTASPKMAHLYVVVSKEAASVERQLIEHCEKEASAMSAPEITTVDYTRRAKVYRLHGWTPCGERGQYTTYAKVFP